MSPLTHCGLLSVRGSAAKASACTWVVTSISSASMESINTGCLGPLLRAASSVLQSPYYGAIQRWGTRTSQEGSVSYKVFVAGYLTRQ